MKDEPHSTDVDSSFILPRSTLFVLRSGALGDFILTLPALHALRQKFPAHHLILAARADVLPLVQGTIADTTIPFDSDILTPLFIATNEPSFDSASSCAARNARQQAQALCRASATRRAAQQRNTGSPAAQDMDKPNPLTNLLTDTDLAVIWLPENSSRIVTDNLRHYDVARLICANPIPTTRHAADYLLDTLAPLGIGAHLTPNVPTLTLSDELRALADDFWRTHSLDNTRVVALHIGSGGERKCWPLDNFIALAKRLTTDANTRVLMIRGPAETEDLTGYQKPVRSIVLNSPSLSLLASILARCALYVGNDSGPTHLAAALGTPTVAFFGPTDPNMWGPRGAHLTVIRSPTARMDDLTVDAVWQVAYALSLIAYR